MGAPVDCEYCGAPIQDHTLRQAMRCAQELDEYGGGDGDA